METCRGQEAVSGPGPGDLIVHAQDTHWRIEDWRGVPLVTHEFSSPAAACYVARPWARLQSGRVWLQDRSARLELLADT